MEQKEELIGITPAEEKELKRVYDTLCDFARKAALEAEFASTSEKLQQQQARAAEIQNENKARRAVGTTFVFDDRALRHQESQLHRIKTEQCALDRRSDRKISAADLTEALIKGEVEDMIWEVDENLDHMVDWTEFKLMFKRNISDRTGLEPSKLYNLVQFMIYDQNENGLVSVDETMNMLYARFGRMKMETKLRELFGEEMHEYGKQGGEIDFLTYLQAVEKIQMRTFWSSPQGKLVMTSRTTPAGTAPPDPTLSNNKPSKKPNKKEGKKKEAAPAAGEEDRA